MAKDTTTFSTVVAASNQRKRLIAQRACIGLTVLLPRDAILCDLTFTIFFFFNDLNDLMSACICSLKMDPRFFLVVGRPVVG